MLKVFRQVMAITTPQEQRKLLLLAIPFCLFGLLNVVGVGVILPFIAVASDFTIVYHQPFLAWLYQTFHFSTPQSFLVFLGLSAFGFLLLVNAFGTLMVWLNAKISNDIGVSLSNRLFTIYLTQPYHFFLSRHSSALSNRVLQMTESVKTGVILAGLQLVSNAIVALSIISLLFYTDALAAALATLMAVVCYGGVYVVVKKRLQLISEVQVGCREENQKNVNEAFAGAKDLCISHRQIFHLNQHFKTSKEVAHAVSTLLCIQGIPKYVFETAAFGGILLMIVALVSAGKSFSVLLPILSMFAYAAYRLMPASNAVLNAISTIKSSVGYLSKWQHDCQSLGRESRAGRALSLVQDRMSFKQSIILDQIFYQYPGTNKLLINSLSLTIPAKEVIGIIGSTGAGKTTLVDIILGLLHPVNGEISVDDVVLNQDNVRSWQMNLGYVAQQIYLRDDTIENNIAYSIKSNDIDHDAVVSASKAAALHAFVMTLPNGYQTLVGERGVRLSGGQRQRIGIARALYHNPAVLVLDEATSALDGATENTVMEAIHALGGDKTIIIIAHRLTTVQRCDRVIMMDDGSVVDQGRFSDLVARCPSLYEVADLVS